VRGRGGSTTKKDVLQGYEYTKQSIEDDLKHPIKKKINRNKEGKKIKFTKRSPQVQE
jgi:hypothetical protein